MLARWSHGRWFWFGIFLPVMVPGTLLVAGDLVFERKDWPAYFARGDWFRLPALESWQTSPSLGLDQMEHHLQRWMQAIPPSDSAPPVDLFAFEQLLRMKERFGRIRWALSSRTYLVMAFLGATIAAGILVAEHRRSGPRYTAAFRWHGLTSGVLVAAFWVFYTIRFQGGVSDATQAWHLLDALPADLARFATPRLYGDEADIWTLAHNSGLLRGTGWAVALLIALAMGTTTIGFHGRELSDQRRLLQRQDLLLYALSGVLITAVVVEFALRNWLIAPLTAGYELLAALDEARAPLWLGSAKALQSILHIDAVYNAVEYCVCLGLVYLPVRWGCTRGTADAPDAQGVNLKALTKRWSPRLVGLLGPYLASILQLLVQ